MHKRYPSLQSMRAFLQAARTGNFSAAARQLNLTHSAISQQIRSLEESVGQLLFIRESGGIALSAAGRLFADALAEGFAQIDGALSAVKNPGIAPSLTISVDAELQTWLNTRLPALFDALSGYRITLLSDAHTERSPFRRADVTLRYGYGEWSDCEVASIYDDHVTAVASPSFAQSWNIQAPAEPARIIELPLLGYTRRSWMLWLEMAGLPPVEPQAIATFDNVASLIAAAEAGLGVGLVRSLLVADALRDGRLIELGETVVPAHYNLYAVWPQGCGEQAAPVVRAVQKLAEEAVGGPRRKAGQTRDGKQTP